MAKALKRGLGAINEGKCWRHAGSGIIEKQAWNRQCHGCKKMILTCPPTDTKPTGRQSQVMWNFALLIHARQSHGPVSGQLLADIEASKAWGFRQSAGLRRCYVLTLPKTALEETKCELGKILLVSNRVLLKGVGHILTWSKAMRLHSSKSHLGKSWQLVNVRKAIDMQFLSLERKRRPISRVQGFICPSF